MTSLTLFTGAAAMALAFLVGFAIRRGSVCTVAAIRQWIFKGRLSRLRGFATAAAIAGAILIPAAWVAPGYFALSPGYGVSGAAIMGGALFGLGAFVNGACAFGTLAYISGGNFNYIGTIAGALFGAVAARLSWLHAGQASPSALTMDNPLSWVFLLVCIVIVWRAAGRRRLQMRRRIALRRKAGVRPASAMFIIGAAGALLYGFAGDWTYMGAISQRAARLVDQTAPVWETATILSALALIAGGVFAALRSGRFSLQKLHYGIVLKTFLGGMIMGFAAAIVPGGNGVMLIYGVPSFAPHAIAGYAAMTMALAGALLVKKHMTQPRRSIAYVKKEYDASLS